MTNAEPGAWEMDNSEDRHSLKRQEKDHDGKAQP
jgi:hypothetical protein